MTGAEWVRRLPWSILLCALGLMLMGLAGISRGDALTGRGDLSLRQTVWILLSVPVMLAATRLPYRGAKELSFPLFLLTLALLVLVFFLPARNGSRRWIPLGGVYLQPSELAKITYVMALAHYLMYRDNYRRLTGLLVPFVITVIPVGLILREPDLGTALLFIPTLFAMLFAAGARLRHLSLVVGLGVCVAPLLWMGMSAEQKSRVVTVFQQQDGGEAPRGDGYHLHQSKLLLAMGGPWGSRLGGTAEYDPLAYHLPAGRTDFVFCLVGERWGLAGCITVLLLYTLLIARGLHIAASTREPFGRLVAVGIVTLLASQALINTGMTVGLMPITGMTLPLLSYGGSSLLSTCLGLGLLMNIGMRPGYEVSPEPFRFRPDAPRF